jgi:hypothetical protein
MQKTITALLGAAMLVLLALPANAAGVTTETRDVLGQGIPGPVYAAGGATLQRSDSGLTAMLTMPTPESGTYLYPPGNAFQPNGAVPGHPEAYSFWVFVFNHPELCSAPCNIDDVGTATPAQGGAFNAGGHIVDGSTLQLSGRVTLNSVPFAGSVLLEPRTAAVHLAVAPHGVLDPALLPTQITKPIGSPAFWWGALFE